jgi:uncharacterized SAM-binding protein YcdF (DUF218 family)
MLALTKTLTALILPPALLLVLLLAALVLLRLGRHRAAAALVATAAGVLYLLSIAPVRDFLAGPLERQFAYPVAEQWICDVIVVLGGGAAAHDTQEGALPALSSASTERVLTAFALWQHIRVPILVSGGGAWESAAPEVPAIAGVLAGLGVPDSNLSLEWWSRNTIENAIHTKAASEAFGWERLCLVTSAWHMPRAARAFRSLDLDVVPVPAGLRGPSTGGGWLGWAPSLDSLTLSTRALREYFALVWYRIRYGA